MFNVEHTYVEAFVGYQKRFGDLTAKAFIGVIGSSHKFDVPDVRNRVAGEEIGAKAALELWLNLGPHAWSSLDLSHATAFETSSARWRGGWRALPNFSIGPEVRYDRNAQDDAGRAGAFVRYDWDVGEISGAVGYAGTMTGGGPEDPAVYATVNLLINY